MFSRLSRRYNVFRELFFKKENGSICDSTSLLYALSSSKLLSALAEKPYYFFNKVLGKGIFLCY